MAKFPAYIPIGELHKFGGPKRTKAYALLREHKLRARRMPWGTMVEGASLAELLEAQPTFNPALPERAIQ